MGYKAKDSVDPLDYDFQPFLDVQGKTPEFTDERIKDYWSGVESMTRRHLDVMARWEKRRRDLGDVPEAAALDEFTDEYEAWESENIDKRRDKRIKLLAMLCDNQPAYDELKQLPSRVFDDFEAAMRDELTPKARKPATS